MTVRMELSRILIRELKDLQIIELREVLEHDEPAPSALGTNAVPSGRTFPIVIGLPEAQAIDRRLRGLEIQRPQTHDLLDSVISALGARLVSITINDLSEHTFFATLDLETDEGTMLHIDARPSDAIALGIASSAEIYVAEHVLDSATPDPS